MKQGEHDSHSSWSWCSHMSEECGTVIPCQVTHSVLDYHCHGVGIWCYHVTLMSLDTHFLPRLELKMELPSNPTTVGATTEQVKSA